MRRALILVALVPLTLVLENCTSETSNPSTHVPEAGPITEGPHNNPGSDASTSADASDSGCPAAWLTAPVVDPSIAVPDGGGDALVHASATGTQNYTCMA